MEASLMLCWVLLWLIPAILDTVVQITNSVVVNKMAQGGDIKVCEQIAMHVFVLQRVT